MNIKTESKINTIISGWVLGNKEEARSTLKKLTKLKLAELLVNKHQTSEGLCLTSDMGTKFNDFVIYSLNWS